MFALRKIVENKLYAIKSNGDSDVFQECFELWEDTLYLYRFFKDRPHALHFYRVDVKQAAQMVINESQQFHTDILEIAHGKRRATSLDEAVFVPLHENDGFDLPLIEAKAYGKLNGFSFLRLYAVRLKDGCYIVVGGLIKTGEALQDFEEGIEILEKLREMTRFLRKKGFEDAFDIGTLEI